MLAVRVPGGESILGNVQHDYTLPMSSNRPLFIVNQLPWLYSSSWCLLVKRHQSHLMVCGSAVW